jgi:hypothetical protein
MVSGIFQQNLNDENKQLLQWNAARSAWHGNVVKVAMEEWYNENCK